MKRPLFSAKTPACGWIGLCAALLLSACSSMSALTGIGAEQVVPEVTAASYAEHKTTRGVVLVDASWDRRWGCSGFENVQLRVVGFDRMPLRERGDDEPADVLLAYNSSMLLASARGFQQYALLLEPGDYALSGFLLRAAASVSDIRYFPTPRSRLLHDGKPNGGSFTVAAGEVVYIGNFWLDCTLEQPVLWRYYSDEETWPLHQREYQAKYPFLDLSDIHYRLFDTEQFGMPWRPE